MNKAAYRNKCERLVRKWQKKLLLDHWTITVNYQDEETNVNGSARMLDGTLRAIITFYKNPDRPLNETALHEVVHILLSDMQGAAGTDQAQDMVERTTDHLVKLLA